MAEALITAAKCFVPKSKEEEENRKNLQQLQNIIATLPETEVGDSASLSYQVFGFNPWDFPCGSYWDQFLGYWKASLEFPSKILFLKYEDYKEEPLLNIKRVAEFVGRPFSLEEEENGTVQEILKLCSFEKMKNLEVSKNGFYRVRKTKNDVFFREGKVGDWENHLTNEMAERLDEIARQKFHGSGLMF
ncbi:flavonol 3-sulfotransferase-like [Pistacia vera]|uniref:flavonol 3-sulfotransferase-like n=1 Tax=Pistacia vera TaxID=55513 RepID=UPI0012638CF6|nr:flavonol 3-sulfotransferase-like [Pistacia vera]